MVRLCFNVLVFRKVYFCKSVYEHLFFLKIITPQSYEKQNGYMCFLIKLQCASLRVLSFRFLYHERKTNEAILKEIGVQKRLM